MTIYFIHYICSLYLPSYYDSNGATTTTTTTFNFPLLSSEYSFPLHHRVESHLFAEVIILFGRSYNEYQYGRWGTTDIMHHSVFIYAVYLGLYFPPCMPFAWLVCHMQALHFPLVLWYLGGKRGSYCSNRPSIVYICRALFPMTWFWAASYRFALMTISSIVSYLDTNYLTTGVLVFMGMVMAYLDYGWSKYFIGALLTKDTKEKKDDNNDNNDVSDRSHSGRGLRKNAINTIMIVIYCGMGLSAGIAVAAGYLQ
jgi:hypothetical protein